MKEIITGGLKLYIRVFIISILSFFVVISIFAFSNAVFAEEVGEKVVVTKGEEITETYIHYYADGEDTKQAELEKKGYTISKIKQKEMSSGFNVLTVILAEGFALAILIAFVYPTLWDRGNKDLNFVKIGKASEDKLKGLKIGLVAAVPSFVMYAILIIGKFSFLKNMASSVYYLMNVIFFPIYKLIFEGTGGNAMSVNVTNSDLGLWQLVLIFVTLFVMPAIAFAGYYLGYKDVAVSEKLLYKKKN